MCRQVEAVHVNGPRYWPQRVAAAGGVTAEGPLASLFRTRTLYVQRKGGALSYMHDPSGVRSLLSHALDEVSTNDSVPSGTAVTQRSKACVDFGASPG